MDKKYWILNPGFLVLLCLGFFSCSYPGIFLPGSSQLNIPQIPDSIFSFPKLIKNYDLPIQP